MLMLVSYENTEHVNYWLLLAVLSTTFFYFNNEQVVSVVMWL